MGDVLVREKAEAALWKLLDVRRSTLSPELDRVRSVKEVLDEALGLGRPLKIKLVRRDLTGYEFSSDDKMMAVIERVVTPLGRRIDESSPLVAASLQDGSRVNAAIPPLALKGPCIPIRKFCQRRLSNLMISGGTGSGKTTLLNVLSGWIPERERVMTIVDAAELQLHQAHTCPPYVEGRGEINTRQLVRNALRMRPDRIVVEECRGGEAEVTLDLMIQILTLTLLYDGPIPKAILRRAQDCEIGDFQARLLDTPRRCYGLVTCCACNWDCNESMCQDLFQEALMPLAVFVGPTLRGLLGRSARRIWTEASVWASTAEDIPYGSVPRLQRTRCTGLKRILHRATLQLPTELLRLGEQGNAEELKHCLRIRLRNLVDSMTTRDDRYLTQGPVASGCRTVQLWEVEKRESPAGPGRTWESGLERGILPG